METNGGYGPGDRSFISGVRIAPPRGYALTGKIMLSAVVVLFAVVVLILFLHIYVRWYLLRLASRRRRRRRRGLPLIFTDGVEAPARGLDPAALASLPVLVYTADESKDGGQEEEAAECAVCINEFEEGEKVRRLPRCWHRFHIECIDMWFHSHATCPLCRSPVEAPLPTAAVQADVSVAGAAPAGDLCLYCGDEGGIGTSSSGSGEPELRGADEEVGLAGGMKSPAGRIRAIRRFLSMDLSLYRVEMAAAADIESGAAERAGDASHATAAPALLSHSVDVVTSQSRNVGRLC